MTSAMTKGLKYRVLHRDQTQRRARTSVMTYLGQRMGDHQFDARPVAGTQTLPESSIVRVVEVDSGTPHSIDGREA